MINIGSVRLQPHRQGLGQHRSGISSNQPRKDKGSPKAGYFVKVPPTRPTRKACQERLACKGPRRIAVYECSQCASLQCEACETVIHENSRCIFHDRVRLPVAKKEQLCDHTCETKNLADVSCEQCKKQLCFACDTVLHHGKSKASHQRITFEADEFFSLTTFITEIRSSSESEQFYSLEENTDCSQFSLDSQNSEFPDNLEEEEEFSSLKNCSKPLDSLNMMDMRTIPDVASVTAGNATDANAKYSSQCNKNSFLLLDDKESLQISNENEFIEALSCKSDTTVKVVSIFGNTGEGKSYTLNHTFFGGTEVFTTSAAQESCTIGVWAAYDPKFNIILLDTEGLLGLTENENQRQRLLLKILAISDVIIYRTRAERLHTDLYVFLGDASKAYTDHFSPELKAASARCKYDGPLSSFGPAVVVFHETKHTELLDCDPSKSAEDILKDSFRRYEKTIDAFSAIQYVGTRTSTATTVFTGLALAIKKQLENTSIRSARTPGVIYKALRVLNDKFSGSIEKTIPSSFLDHYFRCNAVCASCQERCVRSMNHSLDNVPHKSKGICRYQHQYENQIYLCKACRINGQEIIVIPKTSASADSGLFGIAKYAWAGYVLECPKCGIIYRSRQYWFGNREPSEVAVVTEICHVWPDTGNITQSNQNAAQRVIDSVNYLSEAVSNISAPPTKTLASWLSDQIAPTYWEPNYKIISCRKCQKEFGYLEKKHHCRACGLGFCDDCSSHRKKVPERGWGESEVRVCVDCFQMNKIEERNEEAVTVRRVGEVLQSAIGTVASAIDVPLAFVKDSARPTYWIPDDKIKDCIGCQKEFSLKLPLHHCRGCGQGVCDNCSQKRKPVPSRGWDYDVRICDTCYNKTDL